jgi:hypothetical protein
MDESTSFCMARVQVGGNMKLQLELLNLHLHEFYDYGLKLNGKWGK